MKTLEETTKTSSPEKTSTQFVLEAAIDLHNQEQIITRETLSQILPDLPMGKIDDRLGFLVDTGKLQRVQRGVYVPVIRHAPSRPITKYILPDGTVKIDIGDDIVLTLTPREARYLGNVMVAEAMQFSNIELGHHMAAISGQMGTQIRKLSNQIEKIVAGKQDDLFGAE